MPQRKLSGKFVGLTSEELSKRDHFLTQFTNSGTASDQYRAPGYSKEVVANIDPN